METTQAVFAKQACLHSQGGSLGSDLWKYQHLIIHLFPIRKQRASGFFSLEARNCECLEKTPEKEDVKHHPQSQPESVHVLWTQAAFRTEAVSSFGVSGNKHWQP